MVNIGSGNLRWIVHNLINSAKPLQVERVIYDYLDEYPEDVERLHALILKAYSVVESRLEHGTSV
jgi:acid stress-induced BolA-like protein IbaG/YrbA